ncbi:hypothetical protein CO614_02005 [Lysobacteraceae bacterium NML120232]|nr:hypothetical protein CO608_06865 [Xanthomonadaceae bacterium NML08-0793]PJK13167.1 hypothetical protein CO614_02005 [Xanthomonadaceae bacterium NML120232]
MKKRLLPLLLTGLAATLTAQSVPAQMRRSDLTVLPIVNSKSGKVEGAIALEPDGRHASNARWRFGSNTLESAFGLSSGQSLALLCDGRGGIPSRMDRLSDSCALGAIGPASASFGNQNARVGVAIGRSQGSLPSWVTQGQLARSDQTDLALFAEYNLGRNGVVSIAGTTAKARLMTAAELPQVSSQWNSLGLSLGAGVGNFRANVFGRVVDVPGQPGKWQGFGVGLTWHTPWSGQLSVGAENVVTRGRNPFAVQGKGEDEGTVPYVRYQQGL